nr:ACT domain-containing protein [Enterocloster bolteae]
MMEIKRMDYNFSVCKVADYSLVKLDSEYSFIGKTDEEKSLVCITEDVPSNVTEREDGWMAFRIQGVLDFSMIGILSEISGILAENKIGIFVISTYNTDYVLTKKENYQRVLDVLNRAGYKIAGDELNV